MWIRKVLELTPFRGHFIVWEGGVHDVEMKKGVSATAERQELSRLRRENRQLRIEREILSKAAAWFARETGS